MNRPEFNEYLRLSAEVHESSVRYLASLSEDDFLAHLLTVVNDPDIRSSVRLVAVRECINDRIEGKGMKER